MNQSLRSIDLLLRLKRRRLEQLEQQVTTQMRAVTSCEETRSRTVSAESACREAEAACVDTIERLTTRREGFRPTELLTLRHVLDGLVERTRSAAVENERAAQALLAAEQELGELRQNVKRAEHRLELLQEHRSRLAQRLESAQEDGQDEEAEEASVVRLLASARRREAEFGALGTAA